MLCERSVCGFTVDMECSAWEKRRDSPRSSLFHVCTVNEAGCGVSTSRLRTWTPLMIARASSGEKKA